MQWKVDPSVLALTASLFGAITTVGALWFSYLKEKGAREAQARLERERWEREDQRITSERIAKETEFLRTAYAECVRALSFPFSDETPISPNQSEAVLRACEAMAVLAAIGWFESPEMRDQFSGEIATFTRRPLANAIECQRNVLKAIPRDPRIVGEEASRAVIKALGPRR